MVACKHNPGQTRSSAPTVHPIATRINMGKFVVALSLLLLGAGAGAAPPALFEIVPPSKSGVTFVHNNALSPRRYLPESIGPGVAIFDYDNDGWMDLYFTNSGPCDFFQPRQPLRHALYRNNGDGTFTDVTEKAGVRSEERRVGNDGR